MKNTIENATEMLSVYLGAFNLTENNVSDLMVAYTDTVIQSETAALRSEIASLRSRLDDCKRKGITGERV